MARTTPGADSKFKYPAQKSGGALVTTARAFVHEGQTALDRFVPVGMPATIIAELKDLAGRYDQADSERRAGKNGFAAARAGTKTALAAATEALRVLDVVVPNTLLTDSATLGAWHEARHTEASAKVPSRIVTPSVTKTEGQTNETVGVGGEVAIVPTPVNGEGKCSRAEARSHGSFWSLRSLARRSLGGGWPPEVRSARRIDTGLRRRYCRVGESMHNEFTAVFERDGEWFVGYCPEIPGANGLGRTKEDARSSLAEAIALILEDRREEGLRGVPADAERETVTVR